MPPLPCESKRLLALLILVLSCASGVSANESVQSTSAIPVIANVQIGFEGVYKLGCWTPLTIEISAGTQDWNGQVRVTVPDTDGVPTHVTCAAEIAAGETVSVRPFVRVGQSSCTLAITLLDEDQAVVAKREFYLGSQQSQSTPGGYPATNRVLLGVGPALDLEELLASETTGEEHLATRVAQLENADDLPTEWYGYESVETVLLTTSEPDLYRSLSADGSRINALCAWVERGGQLILFCAAGAEELLANEGVLARFAPGRFEKMERLTQPQPLATYSGSYKAVTRNQRLDLQVPSLVDVRGQIFASAGRSLTNVPLVVRTRHGFGEVVFVGLDFDRPPLSTWDGRTSFLKRLFAWQARDENQQTVEQQDTDDVISHLRNSLDKQFVGVSVIPFGVVALLAGVYILLIGPGDYFFVSRVLKRPSLTWLTYPLIVLGISAAAYGIATRMKGDQLRVNQVEIVDVDCSDDDTKCLVRGTVWTHVFTPEVSSLDLELQPSFLGQPVAESDDSLVSWLGLPGYALGGMQAIGAQGAVFDSGYEHGEQLDSLKHLPVQVWSTKTLTARWSATVESLVQSELRQDGEELVVGSILNNSDLELSDCALLYGRWAYNLGRLPAGKAFTIDDSRQPRTVKTLLSNATAGDETVTRTTADGMVLFSTAKWDVARLVKAMMFYKAVNGPQYTNLCQRYQPFVDLSKVLEYDDQAILLARCESDSSHWQSSEANLSSDKDRRWTYYRVVLNVDEKK